jgi:hypothetical protein
LVYQSVHQPKHNYNMDYYLGNIFSLVNQYKYKPIYDYYLVN